MRIPNTGDVLYNCLLHLQEVFSASASPSTSVMYAEQSFAWPMEETDYHDVTQYTQYGRSVTYLPTSLNAGAQQVNGIYSNCAAEQCFHDNSNNNEVNFSLHNVTENELLDLSVKSDRRGKHVYFYVHRKWCILFKHQCLAGLLTDLISIL